MNKAQLSHNVWTRPSYFLAFGFGAGLSPKAPGTCGTLVALPLYWLLVHCAWPIYLLVTIIATIVGIVICDQVTNELGEHDFAGIVWDEIVGFLWTMLFVPVGWSWMLLGFILFRIFDIWKPQPIRYLDDKVQGGFGIMLDDVIAGLFSWLVLQFLVLGIAL